MSLLGGLVGLTAGYGGAALLARITGWTVSTPLSAVAIAVGFFGGGRHLSSASIRRERPPV